MKVNVTMYYVIQMVNLGWNKNNDCLISEYYNYLMHKHNVIPFKSIATTLSSFYSNDDSMTVNDQVCMLAAKQFLSHLWIIYNIYIYIVIIVLFII